MDKAGRNAVKRLMSFFMTLMIVSLIFSVSILIFLTRSGVSIIAVKGDSMSPTFNDSDTIVLIQAEEAEKGQIVILKKPKEWSEYEINENLVKRIIGVPGDTFSFDGEKIRVNDDIIINVKKDNYYCINGSIEEKVLKEGEFLVAGDNHSNSLDSIRIFCDGYVDKMTVKSKDIENYGEIRFIY